MSASEQTITHLFLVRHGQSLYNRDSSGTTQNSGLTELGWRQAQLLADWFARHGQVHAVISSPLMRARQTAEVIAQRLALPVLLQSGLEEADVPYWEELPKTPQDDPLGLWDSTWQPSPERAPGYSQFRARLRQALQEILSAYLDKTVVIVTHAGTIATLLRSLFGGHLMTVAVDNGSITHVSWQDGRWRLLAHNSQTHLLPLGPELFPAPSAEQQPHRAAAQGKQLELVLEHSRRVATAFPQGIIHPDERELQSLVRLAAPTTDTRLLDVATGAGAVALAFAPHVDHVVAVDISPAMLECAERARLSLNLHNVRFRLADATALPFPEHSFDMVTCRELLSYIPQPDVLLAGFHRVLVSRGKLVLDEIVGSDDPVKRATQEAIEIRRNPAFLKLYSSQEIERLVAEALFKIEKLEHYELNIGLEEWLAQAAADAATAAAVRSMLDASIERDAAGLNVRRSRDGSLYLTIHRIRLLATARDHLQAADLAAG